MKTIQRLKSEGHIKPLPVVNFGVAEIERAFMTFTKGAHIGKLLVNYDDQSEEGISVGGALPILLDAPLTCV